MTEAVTDTPNRSAALQHTATKATSILTAIDPRFIVPTRAERDALLVGFAQKRKILYGAAYDMIWLRQPVDLADPDAIAAYIDDIMIYEIKSTNQAKIGTDLKGYFFNITSAELLVAQALGEQYRFAFVNTVTRAWVEHSVSEVMGKARAIYPAFHIRL